MCERYASLRNVPLSKEPTADSGRLNNKAMSGVSGQKKRSFKRWILYTLEEFRKNPSHRRRLAIKTQGKILFLNQEEIEWIEAHGNYVEIHTRDGNYVSRLSISSLENMLNKSEFIRIHRSIIVNLFQIRELRPHTGGEYHLLLTSGTELTMSRSYRHKLRQITGLSSNLNASD